MKHITPEQVNAFVDGTLRQQESAALQEHCSHCVQCSKELELAQLLHSASSTIPPLQIGDSFTAKLMASLPVRVASYKLPFSWKNYLQPALYLTVCSVLALFAGGYSFQSIQFTLPFGKHISPVANSLLNGAMAGSTSTFARYILLAFLALSSVLLVERILVHRKESANA